jgi:hypothetical protein
LWGWFSNTNFREKFLELLYISLNSEEHTKISHFRRKKCFDSNCKSFLLSKKHKALMRLPLSSPAFPAKSHQTVKSHTSPKTVLLNLLRMGGWARKKGFLV